ncbi:MAG: hypothetical protein JWM05_172 [Acidimicrobiales bacterium]|nr:hypothetical protein [Acidimicrobiales bacterium]
MTSSTHRQLMPWKWVEGAGARRPQLPSEHREATERSTRQLLPWPRAEQITPRETLPWEARTGNDWRGVDGRPVTGA